MIRAGFFGAALLFAAPVEARSVIIKFDVNKVVSIKDWAYKYVESPLLLSPRDGVARCAVQGRMSDGREPVYDGSTVYYFCNIKFYRPESYESDRPDDVIVIHLSYQRPKSADGPSAVYASTIWGSGLYYNIPKMTFTDNSKNFISFKQVDIIGNDGNSIALSFDIP